MSGPAIVYRIFDAAGVLIYIGYTSRLARRLYEHRTTKEWWPEVAHIDLALYDDWYEAFLEERRAILAEYPRHNKERHQVVATHRYHVPGWNPIPPDLKAKIAAAGRERSRTPMRAPGRDDALGGLFYQALSLGCQPSPTARAASLGADDLKRLVAKHMRRHPELPPIPVRQSLAARAAA